MRRCAACGWTAANARPRIEAVALDRCAPERRPSTEDQPSVGVDMPVVEEVLGIEEASATRADGCSQLLAHGLGGHDVAADGHDPPADPGHKTIGVAVGGDEHGPGPDGATCGVHRTGGAVDLDLPGWRPGVEVDAGIPRRGQDAGEVPPRMDHARLLDGDAARVDDQNPAPGGSPRPGTTDRGDPRRAVPASSCSNPSICPVDQARMANPERR